MSELSIDHSAFNFAGDTLAVMQRLQQSLRNALGFHVGGAEKIRTIQDRFKLNFPLSWKLYRIVNADNLYDACPQVPVAAAMKRVAAAFRTAGVSSELIADMQAAFEAFEQHAMVYGGDRVTFEGMVSQLAGGDAEKDREFEHRKALFEAERFIGSVEQKLYLSTQILFPSEDPGFMNAASLRSYHNLRRLNPSRPLIVDARRLQKRSQPDACKPQLHPVDEEAAAKYGIPLMPAFCSTTDLPLKTVQSPTGYMETIWNSTTVGQPSTVTVAFGEMIERARPLTDHDFTHWVLFSVPATLYVRDLIVHRDMIPALTTTITRWRNPIEAREPAHWTETSVEGAGFTPLPCREHLTYLGTASGAARLPEAPQYEQMLRFVLTRTRFKLEEFALYRLRLEYPLMYSMLLSRSTLSPAQTKQ